LREPARVRRSRSLNTLFAPWLMKIWRLTYEDQHALTRGLVELCFLSLCKQENDRRFNGPIRLKSFRARLDTMTRDVALTIGSIYDLEFIMTCSEFLEPQTKLEIR